MEEFEQLQVSCSTDCQTSDKGQDKESAELALKHRLREDIVAIKEDSFYNGSEKESRRQLLSKKSSVPIFNRSVLNSVFERSEEEYETILFFF